MKSKFLLSLMMCLTASLAYAQNQSSFTPSAEEREAAIREYTAALERTDSEILRTKQSLERLKLSSNENAQAIKSHNGYLAKLAVNKNIYTTKINELRKSGSSKKGTDLRQGSTEEAAHPLWDEHEALLREVDLITGTSDTVLGNDLSPILPQKEVDLKQLENDVLSEVKRISVSTSTDLIDDPALAADRTILESELRLAEHKLRTLTESKASEKDIADAKASVANVKAKIAELDKKAKAKSVKKP